MQRFVSLDVHITGPAASEVLNDIGLGPQESLDLGEGAQAGRMVLLSASPLEIVSVTADLAQIGTAVAAIAAWLYRLSQSQGVRIEKIERTTVEHMTLEGLTRIIHEQIERKSSDR